MPELPALPEPGDLARRLPLAGERLLVAGAMGTGKSTLAEGLADAIAAARCACPVITADLGQPLFGPPGAAALAERRDERWHVRAIAGVASLDAARFRLPLVEAVRRLAGDVPSGPLLVDAPGVFRGMAAAELLPALVDAAALERVLVLVRPGQVPPVLDDLRAVGVAIDLYQVARAAVAASQRRRVARRSASWRKWLEGAERAVLDLERLPVAGAPPPREDKAAWAGRQAVVLDPDGATLGMGEILELAGSRLVLLAPPFQVEDAAALVVRDAARRDGGELGTVPRAAEPVPPAPEALRAPIDLPPPPGPVVTDVRGTLVGGLLGDPLLVLRFLSSGRHLLLDLGEHVGLPARVAQRASDVFLTHGHLDHLAGFPWLLRRRIGVAEPCRIWGPPGTAAAVRAFVDAVTWDRIGDVGPRFEIAEVDGERVRWWSLQAGRRDLEERDGETIREGLILREPSLEVRSAVLDHGIPVLAYAFQESPRLGVRHDRLARLGLAPGPWVGRMKELLEQGRSSEPVPLPDGRQVAAGELGAELVEERPGQKLVYACDLADTPENRRRLEALAEGAQILVCEAAFAETDRERAVETGHLTARACGEIAAAAGVARLLPFHLSARYQDRTGEVLTQVRAAFPRLWLPRALAKLAAVTSQEDDVDLAG